MIIAGDEADLRIAASRAVVGIAYGVGVAKRRLAHRLDEKYEMFGSERTKLEPSEYMKRNVWYVVEPREKNIDSAMDIIGETQSIWGSDYPHINSSIHAIDQIMETTRSLSEHRRSLVLGENARALYQLDR